MGKTEPRKAEIILEYQNYIESPPVAPAQLYGNACSSDTVTVETWRKIWINNVKANHARFGSFKDHSVGALFGSKKFQPAVIAGSGPSLGCNGEKLKDRGEIPLISCLHNYQFFEDRDVHVDYYVTLDAGDVVVEEVYEGGKKTPDEYWESTKNKTLVAFIGTSPKLFEKWQGKVYFYNAPVPDAEYIAELEKLETFNTYMSNGGNVLGACLYLAKGILGCNPIAFVGADFSFGYNKKFHAWDSKYDAKLGYVIKAIDVFGNKVLTWQSYFNFKNWFDYIALTVPGIYINCTEGGTFGAYPDGNLMAIKQMALVDFIEMYLMHQQLRASCEKPELDEKRLLF
jgi:hypothetical protein